MDKKLLEKGYTIIIMVLVLGFVTGNEFSVDIGDTYPWPVGFIGIFILGIYYLSLEYIKIDPVSISLLSIYIIYIGSYSIFQWNRYIKRYSTEGCGWLVPETNKYDKAQYYLYRILYGITLLILALLCLLKLEENSWSSGYYLFVFALPIILPLFTEIFNSLTKHITGDDESENINPESLLTNFIMGDSNNDIFNEHTVVSIVFYLVLMYFAITRSIGYNTDKSIYPIIIITIFIIFFSLLMRLIFIQDCSVKKGQNIQKLDEDEKISCIPEKYGGLQILFVLSLLIISMYNIKDNIYKILIFLIILGGIWGLSTSLVLNIK